MHAWLEFQLGQHRGIDVHEPHGGVVGKQMTAAFLAPLAEADGSLVIRANAAGAVGHFQRLRVPECEGIDRTCRPVAARLTMTVTHSGRLAGNFELHFAAKTAALINLFATHIASPYISNKFR